MSKSPDEMAAAMVANMQQKTGRTLPQWLKIAKASKLAKHGEIVKFLKGEHGMTHGFANLVALQTLSAGKPALSSDDLVAAQYAGKKEALRPIYEALIAVAKKLGADVEISPKKAYVAPRRSKQFAIVQPSTATRVDVGLNLKGESTTKRLEPAGSLGAMVSHRVRIGSKADVDAQLKGWLKEAYSRA